MHIDFLINKFIIIMNIIIIIYFLFDISLCLKILSLPFILSIFFIFLFRFLLSNFLDSYLKSKGPIELYSVLFFFPSKDITNPSF